MPQPDPSSTNPSVGGECCFCEAYGLYMVCFSGVATHWVILELMILALLLTALKKAEWKWHLSSATVQQTLQDADITG